MSNYTDGVPVKISERFKPPPEIQLPSKLINAIAKNKEVPVAFDDDYNYNFDLEHKILTKTSEWINWRQKQKAERQQRIYERELERQKRLEVEQKEKLNQVSYPSADELSSSADEEEGGDDITSNEAKHSTNIPSETNPFNPNFNSILMPTQATATASSRKSHRRYASNSSNKIDFSFFESEASPFDHLEMKSMNEMEVLAQVLKSTTTVESDESALERNNSSESENSETLRNNNNNNNDDDDHAISVAPQEQPQQIYEHQFNPHQAYGNYYNNYGGTSSSSNQYYNNANYTTTQTHQQQFQTSLYPYSQPSTNNIYFTQNYAVNHMNYNQHVGAINNNVTNEEAMSESQASKSKSVPDIVKELNEELDNSQRRRIRNYSQNSHKEDINVIESEF
jgi:ubiquitin-associated protein 1